MNAKLENSMAGSAIRDRGPLESLVSDLGNNDFHQIVERRLDACLAVLRGHQPQHCDTEKDPPLPDALLERGKYWLGHRQGLVGNISERLDELCSILGV